jgi:hypothetical protein
MAQDFPFAPEPVEGCKGKSAFTGSYYPGSDFLRNPRWLINAEEKHSNPFYFLKNPKCQTSDVNKTRQPKKPRLKGIAQRQYS